jgi:hypothetical protein
MAEQPTPAADVAALVAQAQAAGIELDAVEDARGWHLMIGLPRGVPAATWVPRLWPHKHALIAHLRQHGDVHQRAGRIVATTVL